MTVEQLIASVFWGLLAGGVADLGMLLVWRWFEREDRVDEN